MQVTVWNEFLHEKHSPQVASIYPDGIHRTIADALRQRLPANWKIATATLEQADHGLTHHQLQSTDVLFWWGHLAHDRVDDRLVTAIQHRVLEGMGLIVLHSGHASKVFQRLMGTSCMLQWREAGERERLWVVDPSHPIVQGLNAESIVIEASEMYGEFFDIPAPEELVLISWFAGGEVFRSGCTFRRGKGKIFYFSPGHESYPIYHHPSIQHLLANACRWASPSDAVYQRDARHRPTMPESPE
jgi:trehalose utilization protein